MTATILNEVTNSVQPVTHHSHKRLSVAPAIHATASLQNSSIGAWVEVGPGWTILESVLGDYTYTAGSDGEIFYSDIGKFCSIASHVVINPGDHPVDRITQHHCTYRRRQYGFSSTDDKDFFVWRQSRKCTMGHDVWIGHGAVITSGVTIGTGAVVGAGAVVTRDVAPYEIVVGVPAWPIRRRFSDDVIERILRTAWWDWDWNTLKERLPDLCDVEVFLEKYCEEA
jgi:phosphonate metabolism protein (transferase hexapeptide repeat family)